MQIGDWRSSSVTFTAGRETWFSSNGALKVNVREVGWWTGWREAINRKAGDSSTWIMHKQTSFLWLRRLTNTDLECKDLLHRLRILALKVNCVFQNTMQIQRVVLGNSLGFNNKKYMAEERREQTRLQPLGDFSYCALSVLQQHLRSLHPDSAEFSSEALRRS